MQEPSFRPSTFGPGSVLDSGARASSSVARDSSRTLSPAATVLTTESGELFQQSPQLHATHARPTVLPMETDVIDGNSVPIDRGTCPPTAVGLNESTAMAVALRIIGNAFGSKLEAVLPGRSSPESIEPVLIHTRTPSTRVLLPIFCANHMVLATWVGSEAIVVYDPMASKDSLGNASRAIFGCATPPEGSPILITAPQQTTDSRECEVLLTAAIFFVVTGHPVPYDLDAAQWAHMLSHLCEPLSLDEIAMVQRVVSTFDPASALLTAFNTIPPRVHPVTCLSTPGFGAVKQNFQSFRRILFINLSLPQHGWPSKAL